MHQSTSMPSLTTFHSWIICSNCCHYLYDLFMGSFISVLLLMIHHIKSHWNTLRFVGVIKKTSKSPKSVHARWGMLSGVLWLSFFFISNGKKRCGVRQVGALFHIRQQDKQVHVFMIHKSVMKVQNWKKKNSLLKDEDNGKNNKKRRAHVT